MGAKKMKKNIFQLFIFILTLAISWNFGLATEEKPSYWPTKAWKTGSPESQGVDSEILGKMLDMIWEKEIGIHSVLVIRNCYMVLEAYSYPYHVDDRRPIRSCAKSVTSALVGIAIDKGYIKDIHQPVPANLEGANGDQIGINFGVRNHFKTPFSTEG